MRRHDEEDEDGEKSVRKCEKKCIKKGIHKGFFIDTYEYRNALKNEIIE
jgi:hypothetical protein